MNITRDIHFNLLTTILTYLKMYVLGVPTELPSKSDTSNGVMTGKYVAT